MLLILKGIFFKTYYGIAAVLADTLA